jgi:DNA-binding NtrC family response regulator
MHVMIVDDEQDVKFLFQQKFRKEIRDKKIDLTFAFSAQSALEHLEEKVGTITLVLSDINMPGMSGLDLLQKIKEKFNDLPVWMITAYHDAENYQQALDYGCTDYLTKPIDFPELKQKILSFPDTY